MNVKLKELHTTSAARKAGFSNSRVWPSSVGARIKAVKDIVWITDYFAKVIKTLKVIEEEVGE